MRADLLCIGPDGDVTDAERVMAERRIRRLLVVDGSLWGIVVLGQIARRERSDERMGEALMENR